MVLIANILFCAFNLNTSRIQKRLEKKKGAYDGGLALQKKQKYKGGVQETERLKQEEG